MFTMRVIVSVLSAAAMVVATSRVAAQDYPSKPVRFVTGGVGGGADFTARLLAPPVASGLGQPVIIDNRASGFVPGQVVAQSPPDGYSVAVYGAVLYLETLLRAKAPYDALRDFSAVTLVSREPSLLIVHPSLPVKSVSDLLALIKARPGELNYGSGGTGSPAHLMAELFKSMTGANIVRVPYKAAGHQLSDLAGGHIQMTFFGAAAATPYIKTGRVKLLGITSAQPSPLFPGVPTISAAVPGYELVSMTGVWAPAKTPEPIVRRLNQEFVRALNQPDIREKLVAAGGDVIGNSPEEFAAWLKADIARMGKVIKDANIRTD